MVNATIERPSRTVKSVEQAASGGGTVESWVDVIHRLGPGFAARAADHDSAGGFVAANYDELRSARLFSAPVPVELGGGGATHAEVADIIRTIAGYDGSTALAYAMHAHPVSMNVFNHHRGDVDATRALGAIADGELVIAGTGATDWLGSSGSAERVEGGYRIRAEKRFVSGSAGADLFVTSARYEGPEGPEVIHFAVPFSSDAVRIVGAWDAHGMRGTGSHNVSIEDLFVPDESIVVHRPADVWHPMWNAILPIALPLIVAAYVGLAESAAEMGVQAARRSGSIPVSEVGGMLTQLTVARMALTEMVRLVDGYSLSPSTETADAALRRKAIATDAVDSVVEQAADLVGGAGFLRGHPIERIVRDVRAMRYHPLPARKQRVFTGRVAVGMEPA